MCLTSCVRVLLCLIGILNFIPLVVTTPVLYSEVEALKYLKHFGYTDEESSKSSSMMDYNSVVKDFQKFAGLPETGILDNDTVNMMIMPRCGISDRDGPSNSGRKKRYSLEGSKWNENTLTYRITKYPTLINNSEQVDKDIARAFKVWSDVTPLNFIHTKTGDVHITIMFESREHGDGDPFDGVGQTLAHAFFPQHGGDVHFDDDEKWTIDSYNGINIFQVAVHEFGHSLGLRHSSVTTALMSPFYRGYDPDYKLDEDDILAIQALYSTHRTNPPDISEAPQPTTSNAPQLDTTYVPEPDSSNASQPGTSDALQPDTGDAPDLCQDSSIDAITRTEDGKTYVFKGDFYWYINVTGVVDGYPRRISDDWDGLPGNLDAALTWSDGNTFFFKDHRYWCFWNKKMASGYPKEISLGFQGIPNNVDAAFIWSGNGKTYFFQGNSYWRYDSHKDPPVNSHYPRPINNWKGIPNNIDAVLEWENGQTYFFKGNCYYRFNDQTFAVDSGNPLFPRSTSKWWFKCQPKRNHQQEGDEKL
ncbi:matrix metalloproteinase-15-like [Limulus polyphemus]|uniref:Matrix metalloproteinase-15-like n=1 Tax=Limulus polyphemus TaxID=6850 RepID=A0ABM1B882_LIMPO|nr:matrix metalloproteinase-15-like [Limulus polyphemus]